MATKKKATRKKAAKKTQDVQATPDTNQATPETNETPTEAPAEAETAPAEVPAEDVAQVTNFEPEAEAASEESPEAAPEPTTDAPKEMTVDKQKRLMAQYLEADEEYTACLARAEELKQQRSDVCKTMVAITKGPWQVKGETMFIFNKGESHFFSKPRGRKKA